MKIISRGEPLTHEDVDACFMSLIVYVDGVNLNAPTPVCFLLAEAQSTVGHVLQGEKQKGAVKT